MTIALALPTRRVEEWKYSDLARALGDAGFGEETARARVGAVPAGVEMFALDEPNRPDWVKAHYGKLSANAVSAVSLAKARGGVALRIAKGKVIDQPVTLEFAGQGHVRALLVLEEGAVLTLSERSDPAGTRNIGFEIVLGPNAQLNHVRLSPVSDAVQVEEISMTLARSAVYRGHFASFGAKLARVELDIALKGEGAEAHLSGVSVLSGDRHADVTTHVTHAVGRTQSTQLFKKVAGGSAQAVYQGKVTVAHGADGSDSRQTAKALLLGGRAEADLKPELEIFADDVKCAHGAAVGDLDADSLFYLRARGIPERDARHLLIHAFLEDALTDIANIDLRESVRGAVNMALGEVAA
ncbi:MAG: Fe-S cluster assembly protein SufD [Pseudomonadota bacterium]